MALPRHITLTANTVASVDLTADCPGESLTVALATTSADALWWRGDGTNPAAWADGSYTNFWPETRRGGLDATGRWVGDEVVATVNRPRNASTGAFTGAAVLKLLCSTACTVTIDRTGRSLR